MAKTVSEPITGRLFVPQHGGCIAAPDQTNALPPYHTTLQTCGTTEPQRWLYDPLANQLFWVRWIPRYHGVTVTRFLQLGKTDEEGTDPQGGCGVLGYKAATTGAPVVASGTNTITLECANMKPFALSLAVH